MEVDNLFVVCADGGAALARLWGWQPSVIVGDQDSLDPETQAYWQRQNIPVQQFPTAKDQTDLDLAVEHALKAGATSLTLVGAWGNRIDHSLGNVELLYRLALKGIPNELLTKEHRLSAFCGEFRGRVRVGCFVSLLALSPVVQKVTTSGLLYPLQRATLKKGSTRTISNVATVTDFSVEIGEGVLLVVIEQ